jgi:hypothetical protein
LLESRRRRLWTARLLAGEQEEEVVDSQALCWRAGGGGCGQPGSLLESRWRWVWTARLLAGEHGEESVHSLAPWLTAGGGGLLEGEGGGVSFDQNSGRFSRH